MYNGACEVNMKTETIGTFESPQIPVATLKDMGFIQDETSKKWVLCVGNPLVWYDIELPQYPTWVDFRKSICSTIDGAFQDGCESKK